MRKSDPTEKQEAIERLHEMLKPGDTVNTVLLHVSRSGMQREITLVAFDRSGDQKDRSRAVSSIDHLAAKALGYRVGKHGGIVVGGCWMDMGFHLVYNLGRAMWPDGTPRPHGRRNGEPDRDGGYALKHRWL